MWPRCRKEDFVPTNHAGSMQHLALINQIVLEDKTFVIVDGDYDEDDG